MKRLARALWPTKENRLLSPLLGIPFPCLPSGHLLLGIAVRLAPMARYILLGAVYTSFSLRVTICQHLPFYRKYSPKMKTLQLSCTI